MGKLEDILTSARSMFKLHNAVFNWYSFGPAFLFVIISSTHFSYGTYPVLGSLTYPDAICITCIITTLCVLIFIRTENLYKSLYTVLISSEFATALGYIMLRFLGEVNGFTAHFAVLFSAISMGIFVTTLSILWFSFLAHHPIEYVALLVMGSILLGCILSWLILGMKSDREFITYMASIFISGQTIITALKHQEKNSNIEDKPQTAKNRSLRFLISPLLSAALFSCTLMISVSLTGLELWHTEQNWAFLWPAALILGITLLFSKRHDVTLLLYVGLTLIIAGVLFASFLNIKQSFIAGLATMGCVANIAYLIMLFCDFAHFLPVKSYRLGSTLFFSIFGGFLIGRLTILFINEFQAYTWIKPFIVICLVVAILICTSVSLSNKTIRLSAHRRFRFEEVASDVIPYSIATIEQYAKQKNLGEREREALFLLLEGKSASEIAELMFIAHGTAKAHIRHIYQKLNVHNRDELFNQIVSIDSQFKPPENDFNYKDLPNQ